MSKIQVFRTSTGCHACVILIDRLRIDISIFSLKTLVDFRLNIQRTVSFAFDLIASQICHT